MKVDVEEIDVWYLLVSAFEGGSNYWIEEISLADADHLSPAKFAGYMDEEGNHRKTDDWHPELEDDDDLDELREKNLYVYHSQVPFLGGSVVFKELDSSNHNPKPLNAETMAEGLQLLHDKAPKHYADFKRDPDAITGDVFLQLCIFGDIIYG